MYVYAGDIETAPSDCTVLLADLDLTGRMTRMAHSCHVVVN